MDDVRNDVLTAIEQRRTRDAINIVRATSRSAGIDTAVQLLADVQREVGLRWQTRQWTVAEEHVATSIVDTALTAAALESRSPVAEVAAVLVCCEGEWHGLPARMATEQLRAVGCDVIFLGTSVPAEHVGAYLRATRVPAVLVSCTVPIYLGGARRTIAAAHAAGVPVIVGGAAFDQEGRRAAAIGADASAVAPRAAARLLREWAHQPPQLSEPAATDGPALALAVARPSVVAAAIEQFPQRFPPFTAYTDAQRDRVREDLDYILQFVEAALLTADSTVMTEFVQWLTQLLTAHDLPASIVPLSLNLLRDCLAPDATEARRVLEFAYLRDDRGGDPPR